MSRVDKAICIGDEHDHRLREALMAVLGEMGGITDARTFGVGGSQELETLAVTIGGESVTIEAETYVGLSIRGEKTLVEDIARRVQARMAHP